jgi:transposase
MPLVFESRRMSSMPKKIDPELKARAVRLVLELRGEYPTLTAASQAVAKQVGVGKESVRRWVIQAEIDAGHRDGVTSEESEEIRRLKAENRRLREDVAILKAAATFFASRPPQPRMMGFIDQMRAEGLRSSRSVGCCASRAARSPHGPPGLENRRGRCPHDHRRPRGLCGAGAGLEGRSADRSVGDGAGGTLSDSAPRAPSASATS